MTAMRAFPNEAQRDSMSLLAGPWGAARALWDEAGRFGVVF